MLEMKHLRGFLQKYPARGRVYIAIYYNNYSLSMILSTMPYSMALAASIQ
jgi:hypothetical protein